MFDISKLLIAENACRSLWMVFSIMKMGFEIKQLYMQFANYWNLLQYSFSFCKCSHDAQVCRKLNEIIFFTVAEKQ